MVPIALATELDVLEVLFRNPNKIFFLDTLPKTKITISLQASNRGPLECLCLNI